MSEDRPFPSVTPEGIEATIVHETYFTAYEGVLGERFHHEGEGDNDKGEGEIPETLKILTFCVLIMRNGFTVVGHSACAHPDNFDKELGQQIARKKAVEQIWPLLGYELRSSLHLQQASARDKRAEGERQSEGHDAVGTGPSENFLRNDLRTLEAIADNIAHEEAHVEKSTVTVSTPDTAIDKSNPFGRNPPTSGNVKDPY